MRTSTPDIVVNISWHKLTADEISVFSLGLGFCPDSNYHLFETIKDINLFVCKLNLKALHHKPNQPSSSSSASSSLLLADSQKAPSTPTPLLVALETCDSTDPTNNSLPLSHSQPNIQDLKLKSKTFPPSSVNKRVHLFLKMVRSEISAFFVTNKLPSQI